MGEKLRDRVQKLGPGLGLAPEQTAILKIDTVWVLWSL